MVCSVSGWMKMYVSLRDSFQERTVGKYQGWVQSILSVFSCPDAHIHAVISDNILWKSRCCHICFLFYILEQMFPKKSELFTRAGQELVFADMHVIVV